MVRTEKRSGSPGDGPCCWSPLVAGSLLLVACGDSDPSPTATTEPTSVQATPDEDADAMMDEDGDAMMDEDGDATPEEDADAMMDEDGDATPEEDADAMMDEDGDAMMDEDGDAMMDEDGDAMMDEDGDAMMDEDGDAMMDEDGDAMMSLSDIDETTTGAELIASLSEGEADCLRATIGDASYEAMQDLTLSRECHGIRYVPAAMPGAGQRHRPERSHDVAPGGRAVR